MILNIENYTVKIDFEARTVEVAQAPLNVETETQTTLTQWVPTDAEMVEMHREMNPQPHRGRRAGIVEAEPREVCRSTCCGTLGRRSHNGSCAGCRHLSDEDREIRLWINTDLRFMTEDEE